MFGLIHSLLAEANLAAAQAKAVEVLRESVSRYESSFIESGNSFAVRILP
jgi:hypothetical protein